MPSIETFPIYDDIDIPNIKTFPMDQSDEMDNIIFIDGARQLDELTPYELSKLTPEQFKEALPEGWTYSGSPDGRFVHIKDGNGNYRVRIDPSDKVNEYPHMHVLDGEGNALDVNGNIVPSNSPDAHIPR